MKLIGLSLLMLFALTGCAVDGYYVGTSVYYEPYPPVYYYRPAVVVVPAPIIHHNYYRHPPLHPGPVYHPH